MISPSPSSKEPHTRNFLKQQKTVSWNLFSYSVLTRPLKETHFAKQSSQHYCKYGFHSNQLQQDNNKICSTSQSNTVYIVAYTDSCLCDGSESQVLGQSQQTHPARGQAENHQPEEQAQSGSK